MDVLQNIVNFITENKIHLILSFITAVFSSILFIIRIIVKSPIERLWKTSISLFIDSAIKNSIFSFIMITAITILFELYNPLELINGENKIPYIVANVVITQIFFLYIGFLQYLWFTVKRKTSWKILRWFFGFLILFVVLLGSGIIAGYFWKDGNKQAALIYIGLSTMWMTLVISGLIQELGLIHKNRPLYGLRMVRSINISSFPSSIYHTQTISGEAQVFEPASNQENISKIYYIFYPREQVAIKYSWEKKN